MIAWWSGCSVRAALGRGGLGLLFACGMALGCSSAHEPVGDGMRGPRGAGSGGGGANPGPGAAGTTEIPGGQTMQPTQPPPGAAGTAAGGSGGRGSDCATISQTAEVMVGAVDIVWVIDGSGSMLDEIAAVEQNITNFANQIASAGI